MKTRCKTTTPTMSKKKTALLDRILEDCCRVIFACSYGNTRPDTRLKIFGAYKVSRRDFHVVCKAILRFVERLRSTLRLSM